MATIQGREPVNSVSAEVFALVKAEYLLRHRRRLEESQVPLFLVKTPGRDRHEVLEVGWGRVEAAAQGTAPGPDFALAKQWAEPTEAVAEPVPPQDSFQARWDELMAMSPRERIEGLSRERKTFQAQVAKATLVEKAAMIVEITESAFLVNRASMSLTQEGLAADDQTLAKETTEIIKAVMALVQESDLAITLFQTLKDRSSGHTLGHIVRVFSTMATFLHWYNKSHAKGLNQKLRSVFATHYRSEYQRLLPSLSESQLVSDNVVRLPSLTEVQLRTYALGALMHDVGKIMDLQYFEKEGFYDSQRIKQHPIIGSGLFLKAYGGQFEEARIVVGDHHNYLNHEDGYGISRWERARGGRPRNKPICCVSDKLDAYQDGEALAFLPVEFCTIVDVFDALTDPSRQYRTQMTPAETAQFMNTEFRVTGKVDPVLFDLFVDFLRSLGHPVPEHLGFQARLSSR